VTGKTLRRIRRRLRLPQTKLAALLGTTGNSVARMERDEQAVSEPMARLVLLVAHDLETGRGFVEKLARKRRVLRRAK
jgi:transcriptional regulator with XRE-family HTH domain